MTLTHITIFTSVIPMPVVWLFVGIVVMMTAEVMTKQWICFCFGMGCVAGGITAFITINNLTQIIIFLVVSALLLLAVRPMLVRWTASKKEVVDVRHTVGSRVKITRDVEAGGTGAARIEGINRTVTADHDISVGTEVYVKYVGDGIILVDEKKGKLPPGTKPPKPLDRPTKPVGPRDPTRLADITPDDGGDDDEGA